MTFRELTPEQYAAEFGKPLEHPNAGNGLVAVFENGSGPVRAEGYAAVHIENWRPWPDATLSFPSECPASTGRRWKRPDHDTPGAKKLPPSGE